MESAKVLVRGRPAQPCAAVVRRTLADAGRPSGVRQCAGRQAWKDEPVCGPPGLGLVRQWVAVLLLERCVVVLV